VDLALISIHKTRSKALLFTPRRKVHVLDKKGVICIRSVAAGIIKKKEGLVSRESGLEHWDCDIHGVSNDVLCLPIAISCGPEFEKV
jgi:hypothetical protein